MPEHLTVIALAAFSRQPLSFVMVASVPLNVMVVSEPSNDTISSSSVSALPPLPPLLPLPPGMMVVLLAGQMPELDDEIRSGGVLTSDVSNGSWFADDEMSMPCETGKSTSPGQMLLELSMEPSPGTPSGSVTPESSPQARSIADAIPNGIK